MKVRIQAKQTVIYNQVVEMPKADYKKLTEGSDTERITMVETYLDFANIIDAEPLDPYEIEASIPKESPHA